MRKADPRAWALKEAAVAWYGAKCVGCGLAFVEELFIGPRDALLDASNTILMRGKDYRLGTQHLIGLHTWIIDHEGPSSHMVSCWRCWKKLGRARRRSEGIVHWRSPKAIIGFNAVERVLKLPPMVVRKRKLLK